MTDCGLDGLVARGVWDEAPAASRLARDEEVVEEAKVFVGAVAATEAGLRAVPAAAEFEDGLAELAISPRRARVTDELEAEELDEEEAILDEIGAAACRLAADEPGRVVLVVVTGTEAGACAGVGMGF
ncbi:hypothetical protein ABW21_db0206292 [Orbilia brochopaga]|nr:hypothetical protein ABW21_db0206292 [Drechslerella brochopaga]